MIREQLVFQVLQAGVALYCGLTASQALVEYDRYTSGGLLDHEISNFQFEKTWQHNGFKLLFMTTRFKYTLVAQIIASVVLGIDAATGCLSPWPVFILFITNILIGIRHHAGLNGTYHVNLSSIIALLWASLTSSRMAQTLAVVFIAVQVTISYAVSGWLKIRIGKWQDGSILQELVKGEIWVSDTVAAVIMNNPWLTRPLSVLVVTAESLFLFVLIVPEEIAAVFLLSGLFFHIINALAMGLNSFLVIFPATYPAIYYTNRLVHSTLFSTGWL